MAKTGLSLRIGGILLLTIITYLPVIMRGGWIWDDDVYVTQNQTLHSAAGLGQIWANSAPQYNKQYYPLVHTTFWLEYHAWGLNPLPYHVDNVLLQALNAVLVWIILRKLAVPGAWLIAAIFAVHPLEVESVAWVTERKNVLSAAFYLLSMLAYWRFVGVGGNGGDRDAASPTGGSPFGTWGFYGLSLVLFVCALLSKSVTCSLPVIILLLLWWKKPRLGWRDVWPLIPFVAIGLILGLHTAAMEKANVGAHGAAWNIGPIERFLIAGRALWFYVGKLLWPSPLMFIYPRWDVSREIWWLYLFPLGWLAVLAILFSLRKRIGRGPLVAVLYFSITLFPALGFVNTYPMLFSFVADHFQYLAGIGIITLVVSAATLAARHFKQQRIAAYVGGAVLVALMALTVPQGFVYQNAGTLWSDAYDKNPKSFIVCENLGTGYFEVGRYDDATKLLKDAKDFNPSWINGYMNLGIAYEKNGQAGDAIKTYEEGLREATDDSGPYAVSNLWCAYGAALAHLGEQKEAAAAFDRAITLAPNNYVAQTDAGLMDYHQGNLVSAEAHWRRAIADWPSYMPAHLGLGYLCMRQGNFAEAQAHFIFATLVEPGNPEYARRLALAWARGESTGEAIGMAQRACQMSGNADPLCNLTLAFVYATAGEFDEAVAAAEQAEKTGSPDGKLKVQIEQSIRAYKARQQYSPEGLDGNLPQPVAPGENAGS